MIINPITSDQITTNSITINPITTNSITTNPITTNPITINPITNDQITTGQITNNPIIGDQITSNPINNEQNTTDQINTNLITNDQITSNPINNEQNTTDQINTNLITNDPLIAIPTFSKIVSPSSSSKNLGLIIVIIIGVIVFIIGIIITIILINKKMKKENYDESSSIVDKMKKNKTLADNLLKELKIEIYSKNIIKDYSKCIICNKDFVDNLSRVITIKCGHTFHQPCFKNHIYANLIDQKCPICSRFLFEYNSEVKINLSNPTTLSDNNPDQTNDINLIMYKN